LSANRPVAECIKLHLSIYKKIQQSSVYVATSCIIIFITVARRNGNTYSKHALMLYSETLRVGCSPCCHSSIHVVVSDVSNNISIGTKYIYSAVNTTWMLCQ